MTTELIRITTNEEGQALVSARELHEFLEVTERFQQWFNKRIKKYNFVENEDFTGVKSFTLVNNGANIELQDYAMTTDMAKELSMIQNTEKGKQARKYFIECEKKLKEVAANNFNLPGTYKEALLALVAAEEEKETLIAENMVKEAKLLEQAPKVDLYEDFISTENLYSVNDIAKVLAIKEMGRNNLYKFLRWNKIFMDGFEAYQKHVKSGHVVHRNRTYEYGKGDNKKTATEIVGYFTPKGVEYLYKKLRKEGYVTNKTLETIMNELQPTNELDN